MSGGRWEPLSRVLFANDLCHCQPELKALLVDLNLPVACHVPRWLEQVVMQDDVGGRTLTPALVRQHLRRQEQSLMANPKNSYMESLKNVSMRSDARSDGLPMASALLDYLFSDVDVPEDFTDRQLCRPPPQLIELNGLPLLPIQEGGSVCLGTLTVLLSPPAQTRRDKAYLLLGTSLERRLAGAAPQIVPGLPLALVNKLMHLSDKCEPFPIHSLVMAV